MKMNFRRLTALSLVLALGACQSFTHANDAIFKEEAQIAEKTPTQLMLEKLPPADQPVVLSVYEFQDQTGQQKANDNFADFSSAVTKGGVNILYKALLDAGKGGWFTVIERAGLKNLQQERQIIRATRQQYTSPDGQKLPDVDPLLYAGVILEGGIVAYETNTITGGAGAAYLGITGNTQYRRDMVTVYLRAISVQNGEVLASVNTTKTIYSANIQANIFKYVSFDEILQAETGYSVNEPPQMAVRQAVEYGVYSLIMEGAIKGLWSFGHPANAKDALKKYLKGRDGAEPSDVEVNRILGGGSNPVVPVMAPAPQPERQHALPPVSSMDQPVSRPETHQQQTGTTGGNVYAAPAAPESVPASPSQVPSNSTYVEPAPGDKPAEEKIKAETFAPAPQLFKNDVSGGPVYDVVCNSRGCFPSTGATGAATPPPAAGR